MTNIWTTHKWEIFIIPERILKNHPGMDLIKSRPVLILSNIRALDYKALVMEMSTKPNKNSLFLYSWNSKKTGEKRTSYIAMDKIHTIDVSYLEDKNKIRSRSISLWHRQKILDYLNKIINSN